MFKEYQMFRLTDGVKNGVNKALEAILYCLYTYQTNENLTEKLMNHQNSFTRQFRWRISEWIFHQSRALNAVFDALKEVSYRSFWVIWFSFG